MLFESIIYFGSVFFGIIVLFVWWFSSGKERYYLNIVRFTHMVRGSKNCETLEPIDYTHPHYEKAVEYLKKKGYEV